MGQQPGASMHLQIIGRLFCEYTRLFGKFLEDQRYVPVNHSYMIDTSLDARHVPGLHLYLVFRYVLGAPGWGVAKW